MILNLVDGNKININDFSYIAFTDFSSSEQYSVNKRNIDSIRQTIGQSMIKGFIIELGSSSNSINVIVNGSAIAYITQ